ncbi:MAG: hypothetical protein F6K28_40275 [Microcoleus sp. SIO2G3]|nr:hypothetical protein [Microcoleus sp. SIO2G3]
MAGQRNAILGNDKCQSATHFDDVYLQRRTACPAAAVLGPIAAARDADVASLVYGFVPAVSPSMSAGNRSC